MRLDKTIAMTDGTKLQIEAAFVANGLGADILMPGMTGMSSSDLCSSAADLASKAKSLGYPVSDYILSGGSSGQVFITCEHDEQLRESLRYYKMGEGPYYTLMRNYHLGFFEIGKTIRQVLRGGDILLNNGKDSAISVAAIAKRLILRGEKILRGTGSYDTRGIAVRIREYQDHVPIGLLQDADVIRTIESGQYIGFDDVDLPQSRALEIWQKSMFT